MLNQNQYILSDGDGTVVDFTPHPKDSRQHECFVRYVRQLVQQDRVDHFILVTAREEDKSNPFATTTTVNTVFADALAIAPNLPLVSSQGLICTIGDDIVQHPALAEAQPLVKESHRVLQHFKKLQNGVPLIYEEKITGVTVNFNFLQSSGVADKKTQQNKITAQFQEMFEPLLKDTELGCYAEPGAIEIRLKNYGKKEGVEYFIENGLIAKPDAQLAFCCDSLKHGGTDLRLAEWMVEKGQNVVHVTHENAKWDKAAYSFRDPKILCEALCDGFSPFAPPQHLPRPNSILLKPF